MPYTALYSPSTIMPQITDHRDFQGFPCRIGNCEAVFTRSSDRTRHQKKHRPYHDRPFKCKRCYFRANLKQGLITHENSVHKKIRLPCRFKGCPRHFSDPSSESRHFRKTHGKSLEKGKRPAWIDLTSTFSSRPKATPPVDATVAHSRTTEVERRSPDVSSANVTLHTSSLGREGFPCQDLLVDSSRFQFAPSPAPLLEPTMPYQPDLQFQSSSSFYPSESFYPTAVLPGLSLPETNLNGVMPPCGFQIGVGVPDVYGTPFSANPANQSVGTYFHTLPDMPEDNFLPLSTDCSFVMSHQNTIFPNPSLIVPPPMTNYDATYSDSNLLCEQIQQWHFDTPALNFGYGDTYGTHYGNGMSSFTF